MQRTVWRLNRIATAQAACKLLSSCQMKGRTAYFVFSEEYRQTVRDELLRERGESAKVSVAEVAKVLGQRWKQLSDQEKESYKAKAQEQQAAAAAEAAVHGDGEAHGEGDVEADKQAAGAKESTPLDSLLPLSVVRRVMLLDEDVSRVSQDAVVAVAAATDLLLGLLAKQAVVNAKAQKRRTIHLKDFVQAVKQDRRMAQAGLRDVEAAVAIASEADAAARNLAREAKAAAAAAAAEAVGEACEGDGEGAGGEGRADPDQRQDEGENQDPAHQQAVDAAKQGKAAAATGKKAKSSGSGSGEASKRSRADKEKAAALGARKINTFFTKAS